MIVVGLQSRVNANGLRRRNNQGVSRFAMRLEAERPGIGVTRAEAVRVLLVDALAG